MYHKTYSLIYAFILFIVFGSSVTCAAEQPIAIFHAFDEFYDKINVCDRAKEGYSHIQIAPAQRSNPKQRNEWFYRYQPVEYDKIEGRGSEEALKKLIDKASSCKPEIKVIADVVFNHMASEREFDLKKDFPEFSEQDFFHDRRCSIDFNDPNRSRGREVDCSLGDLPDLDQSRENVRDVHKAHLKKLIGLGIGGFRFDAAKHMSQEVVKEYIDFIDTESNGNTWNYLEVIEDGVTGAEAYNGIAAVTDFILYNSMKDAFVFGDLRTFPPKDVADPRSVTFGENHDTIRKLNPEFAINPNPSAINPYDDRSDAQLATAFVLARESGTPLIFSQDNLVSYIPTGVKFGSLVISGVLCDYKTEG